MAKEVSTTQVINLVDEEQTEVVLRPSNIKTLKKFMKTFSKLAELNEPDQDAIMDILVEASAVALQKQLPEATAFVDIDPNSKNADQKKKYQESRDMYEEMIDMDIVNLVNEVCGGIKFDDPNLQLAAGEAAGTN